MANFSIIDGQRVDFVPHDLGGLPIGTAARQDVVVNGERLGAVEYVAVRRRAPEGSTSATGFVTHYGWRPVGKVRIDTRGDAVRRLLETA